MTGMTRKEFIRKKRRSLKKLRKALNEVRRGCALHHFFGGTRFYHAFLNAEAAYKTMDEITKPLA